MYKVLALDLDGTVLTAQHTIHPEVRSAIQHAAKHCHVMIVTGRHHTAARPYYDELGLTTPVICCNGTYIYDYQNEKVLTQTSIAKDDALAFIELAQNKQFKLVLYTTNEMTYSKSQPIDYMKDMEQWAADPSLAHPPKIYRIDSFEEQVRDTDYVWKFVVEGDPNAIEQLMDVSWVNDKFTAERSWVNRIDIACKGNNKGMRLAQYVNQLGLEPEQVIAVGDNHNDISMIQYAGLGVAMPHADDAVKAQANAICATDNNHDGLARLIREKIQG